MSAVGHKTLVATIAILLVSTGSLCQQPPPPSERYIPPEFRPSDPGIQNLIDSASKAATEGQYSERTKLLQQALTQCAAKSIVADKAIVEDDLGSAYFMEGRLDDARTQWINALSDSVQSSSLSVQADALVALSGLAQALGNFPEALDLSSRAVEVARKSQDLYVLSRALGEHGRLQLTVGKKTEASASIEEALRIDRVNKYDWEAGHLLYLAWVMFAEPNSDLDKGIETATSARNLAIRKENYLVFIQASTSLGLAYAHKGQVNTGIQLLERTQVGTSDDGKPLFERPSGYRSAVSLPFLRIIFLEALAMTYQEGQRPDDALTTWRQLYDTAATTGSQLAIAEAAQAMADLYSSSKDYDKAISNYSLAAEAWARAGNRQRRIAALDSEKALLFRQDRKSEELLVNEQLLTVAKDSKNFAYQFTADLAIAEILAGSDKLDRVETALKDAEPLVTPDVTVPGVLPSLVFEFYIRLADLYEKRKDLPQQLVALEKAVTPAIALANAPADAKNNKPLVAIIQELQAKIAQNHIREAAEKSYADGDLVGALVNFELLRYFDEMDAAWNGKSAEYARTLGNDAINQRLLEISSKVISQDNGAVVLAKNIEDMGPIANTVRLTVFGMLTNYYVTHQRPDMAVKYGRLALPSLALGASETPSPWAIAMSCELAYALMMEKDFKSAIEVVNQCMTGSKKLGTPQALRAAHQMNAAVLDAAGKHDEAQESIQFLLKETPDDPSEYVQLAQVKAMQNDGAAAADAWRKAIQLYESHNNQGGAAYAHLSLADLLPAKTGANPNERRVHLEAADALYRQLDSSEGRVKAEASLGAYYAEQKNDVKAKQYFEDALKVARDAKRVDLEADILSRVGQAYQNADNWITADEYFTRSAALYHQLNDSADESTQLREMARNLNASYRPEEALNASLRAEALADKSESWLARYRARRTLADIYGSQGQYQGSLNALHEARQICDAANQPLFSAWAALASAGYLEIVGDWQDALEQINSIIPVLQQFKDTDDEVVAYTELVAIYGSRESEIKDLNKALEYYQKSYQLVATNHPEKTAVLNIDLVETYWQMGQFKDAIAKANEALEYYKRTGDDMGQANVLISLAEAQRSDGDLQGAAHSLQLAEPTVMHANNFYMTGRFYYGRAGLLAKQGQFKDAIEQYQQVIKQLEQFKDTSDTGNRRLVSETYSFIYDDLIWAYYSLGASDKQDATASAEKALEYAELNKSRIFANSWGLAFVAGLKSQVPAELLERERVIVSQKVACQSQMQAVLMGTMRKPIAEVQKSLGAIDEDHSALIQQLRKSAPAYAEARYPQAVTIAQIPIYQDELFIEFKVLQDSLLVWMVEGSAEGRRLVAFYKVDRSKQWFERQILAVRNAFNAVHPEQFDPKISEELFNALFPEPYAGNLTKAKLIIFVPDDILFLLPFEMLSPRGSKGQFVLLGTPTEYFPSAAAFKLLRATARKRPSWQEQFIGIGDPITSPDDDRYIAATVLAKAKPQKAELVQQDSSVLRGVSVDRIRSGGMTLERIPGTATEVNSIAGLFSGGAAAAEVRTGMDATKQELIQTDLKRFRFVHFATHGILPVEAAIKEPALVLSYEGTNEDDMLLSLSEVFQLKLNADMVVLSACNTGSGKVTRAEGVASLGTAFLAAGASSVTVSLWQVSDNSTAIFMQEFYRNLIKGMPKAASLAAAREFLVAQGYSNPFFWAPFVLTGE